MIITLSSVLALFGCASKSQDSLVLASKGGDLKTVSDLIDSGADPNASALDDWTPLTMAAKEGHKDVVEYLLKRGADPNKPVGNITPLYWASFEGHTDVVEILVSAGAKLNLPDSNRDGFLNRLRYSDPKIGQLLAAQLPPKSQ